MKKIAPYLQPALISLFIFSIMLFFSLKYLSHKHGQWEKDIRTNLMEILVGKKSKIEKALFSRIYYTKGVASFISLNPNITSDQFRQIAHDFVKDDSIIGTMAISKNCILSAIYPLEGHEKALGLNLLDHPERREIVEKTIETRKTFVAGPVELVEGGMAFISYTPVFDKTKSESGVFWGVADIVIKVDALFREAHISPSEEGLSYAIQGYNGMGEMGDIFLGNPEVFKNNPEKIKINLPYGNWVLAVVPEVGWNKYVDKDAFLKDILIIASFIISILLGLFVNALIRLKSSERRLSELNQMKDKFISVLAHDIRSPLANINGFAKLLQEANPVDQNQSVYISTIYETSTNAIQLLENLLGWAESQQKAIAIDLKQVDLNTIVKKELEHLNLSIKNKEIQIINEISSDCQVTCDVNLTGTILRNLLSNAIKFSHKQSSIVIRNSMLKTKRKVFQEISITDQGIGIENSALKNLFENKGNMPAKGTDNELGSGLGLLLCKNFVVIQGGMISARSKKGEGSTFSFTLPVV